MVYVKYRQGLKIIRRFCAIFLSLLLLFSFSARFSAFAADEVSIRVKFIGEVRQGAAGVRIPVRISERPRWGAAQLVFSFDSEALVFKDFELNEYLRNQMAEGEPIIFAVNDKKAAEGSVTVGFATASTAGGYEGYYGGNAACFGELIFDVSETAAVSNYSVSVSVTELSAESGESGEPTAVPYGVSAGGLRVSCNHEWELSRTVPATCETDGRAFYTCKKCGVEKTEVLTATGHKWGPWILTSPATCVSKAVETRYCENDGSHFETREVGEFDMNAHDWGEWELTEAPTVLKEGTETRYCRRDSSHFETRPVPKLTYKLGDIDSDGVITVSDALLAMRISAHIIPSDVNLSVIADVDLSGDVTICDAIEILRCSIGIIDIRG